LAGDMPRTTSEVPAIFYKLASLPTGMVASML
jgi:hypothetical protein